MSARERVIGYYGAGSARVICSTQTCPVVELFTSTISSCHGPHSSFRKVGSRLRLQVSICNARPHHSIQFVTPCVLPHERCPYPVNLVLVHAAGKHFLKGKGD